MKLLEAFSEILWSLLLLLFVSILSLIVVLLWVLAYNLILQ